MVLKFIGFLVLFCHLSNGLIKNYAPYFNGRNICYSQYGKGICKQKEECEPYINNQIDFFDFMPCYNNKICCPPKAESVPEIKVAEDRVNSFNKRTETATSTIAPRRSMSEAGNQTPAGTMCMTDRRNGNCFEGALCKSKLGIGKCVQLKECVPFTTKSISYQNLSRCAFAGKNEIICCPPSAEEPKREYARPQVGPTKSVPNSSVSMISQQSPSGQTANACNTTSESGNCFEGRSCITSLGNGGICRKFENCVGYGGYTNNFQPCARTLICCPLTTLSQLGKDEINRSNRGSQTTITSSNSRTVTTTPKPISPEGNSCSIIEGSICKALKRCEAYMSGKIEKSKLRSCSNSPDLQDIVCCPPISTLRTDIKLVSSMRPAERACEFYKTQNPRRSRKHIKGARSIKDGEFPHIGFIIKVIDAVNRKYKLFCGVALVSEKFALTTVNCARSLSYSDIVLFGSVTTDLAKAVSNGYSAKIKNIWLSDDNIPSEDYHDLALLEFKTAVSFSRNVHPACLHIDQADLPRDMNLTVHGWTTTNPLYNYKSAVLYASTVNTIQLHSCNYTHYHELGVSRKLIRGIHHGQYCTRNVNAKNCDGDVGFPLTAFINGQFEIVGILSKEFGCYSNAPSIYTRVAYYIDWIEEMVWSNSS